MKPHTPQHPPFRRAASPPAPEPPYSAEANRYPAVVVHEQHGKKTVNSKDEHDALGEGWAFAGHEKQD